jgi:hypothetical protein
MQLMALLMLLVLLMLLTLQIESYWRYKVNATGATK